MAKKQEEVQLTYAAALQRLQVLVGALESGSLDIDQMLAHVAEAENLVLFCRTRLRDAGASLEEIMQRMKAV